MGKITVEKTTCKHIVINVDNEKHVFTKDDLESKDFKRPNWLRKLQKLTKNAKIDTPDDVKKFLKNKDLT